MEQKLESMLNKNRAITRLNTEPNAAIMQQNGTISQGKDLRKKIKNNPRHH